MANEATTLSSDIDERTAASIRREDRFTLTTYSKLPIVVERGEGSFIWDDTGRRFLDFYGGHCVTVIGHAPPRVAAAISDQASRLIFYSNAVYSDIRSRAAERLISLCPDHLVQAFLCNSGTEANEAALKMARKTTGRTRVVAMDSGFHGRTLGSLAVTSGSAYRSPYEPLLPEVTFVPFGDAGALETALGEHPVAGVILEPIQSMAGVVTAEAEYFRTIASLTESAGALLIFDEVQTGVGRTGTFSISEYLGVRPNIVTLAKSLGSGVPVGAVVADRSVSDAVLPGDHGSTFGGGMIAMAAMLATLEAVSEPGVMDRASIVYETIARAAADVGYSARGRGCLIGLDVGRECREIRQFLFESDVIVGSSSDPNVFRVFPPLTVTDDELDLFVAALQTVSASVEQQASADV